MKLMLSSFYLNGHTSKISSTIFDVRSTLKKRQGKKEKKLFKMEALRNDFYSAVTL